MELIYKVKSSVYIIVSLLHVSDGEAMLFVNWGRYFDRLQNPQVQMPRIEKNCPTLYAVMTGDDPDGVYECDCRTDGTMYHGFSLKMDIPANLALVECVSKEVFDKGRLLANKALMSLYALGQRPLATSGTQELYNNPPFPAWRSALPLIRACES